MVILSLTEQMHLPWILWLKRENTHWAPLILLSVRVVELQKTWNKLLTPCQCCKAESADPTNQHTSSTLKRTGRFDEYP